MDPLIRSAQLAPLRMRLSETRAAKVQGSGPVDAGASREEIQVPASVPREEIERQVRAEMTVQSQKLYEAERQRAHEEGYAAGLAAANAAAADELAKIHGKLQTKLDGAVAALEGAHQTALARLESSVGEVAFAVVCRFVGEKATSESFVLGLVEQACAQLRTDASATARLHPRDIGTLHGLLDNSELRIQSLGLKLVADESLQLGGCIIEAASGQYDAGLENQLRRLHAVLTQTAGAQ